MVQTTNQGRSDRAHLLDVLAGWLAARWPAAADLAIDDLGGPSATGFSNDTVFFRARWQERGQSREERYVARIHRIDWRQAGLDWLVPQGKTPGLRWQLDLYRDNAHAELRGRVHPILEQAFTWLETHYPGESEHLGISWGDARLGNMIFRDYECVAVTDWEAVALGPPELDLGWWLMFDRFIHESSGVTTRMDGMPTREEQKAYYAAQLGRDIGDTHYFEVFGATRFTAVMIRTMDRMTKSGMMPPEMNAGVHNVATQVLADLLGIPYDWMNPPR